MKLRDLKEMHDEEDEFPVAKLKHLGDHIHHGRIWVNDRNEDVNDAYSAAEAAIDGEGDVLVWYNWMSETVYEISIASTTREGVKRVIDAVLKVAPRSHAHVATKKGIIDHGDWRPYQK